MGAFLASVLTLFFHFQSENRENESRENMERNRKMRKRRITERQSEKKPKAVGAAHWMAGSADANGDTCVRGECKGHRKYRGRGGLEGHGGHRGRRSGNAAGKRALSVVLLLLLMVSSVFSFAGCEKKGEFPSGGLSSSEGGAGAEEGFLTLDYADESFSEDSIPDPVIRSSEESLTVKDCLGNEAEIPRNPEHVAVLDSFAGEAMVMIGAGSRMVTCPNGVKSDSLLREIYPGLGEVSVVMSGGSFNAEALLQLSPDVIIIKEGVYVSEGEREKLDKLNIPYLVTAYGNMAEQMYALSMIGAAAGDEYYENAQEINRYYCDVIRRVCQAAENIPQSGRRSVYHSINEAVRTDGRYSLGNDWITCVGADNVSARHAESLKRADGDYATGLEQIFVWDPDVMICNETSTKDYLLTDSKWQGLRAVKEGEVYNIPGGATRWGQRGSLETFFAMIWLGVTIYPEYYAGFDLRQEVTDFYRDQLGLEVDNETWRKMTAGTGIRDASNVSGT